MTGSGALKLSSGVDGILAGPSANAVGQLYSRLWGGDWLLAALPVLGLIVLVAGGFFLVRGES